MVWCGKKSVPQVVVDSIREAWRKEVPEAAKRGHADAKFEYATLCIRECMSGQTGFLGEAERWLCESAYHEYRLSAVYNNLGCTSEGFNDESGAALWFERATKLGSIRAPYNRG